MTFRRVGVAIMVIVTIVLWLPGMRGGRVLRIFSEDLACSWGDASSCYEVGLEKHEGSREEYESARHYYELGCTDGHAPSCNNLGWLHGAGLGTPRNHRRALRLYLKACEAGHLLGCANAGTFFSLGQGVRRNAELAETLLRMGCVTDGEKEGCLDLWRLLLELPGREIEGRQGLTQACTQTRNSEACHAAALTYLKGEGTPQDVGLSLRLARMGCRDDHPRSCAVVVGIAVSGLAEISDSEWKDAARVGCQGGLERMCEVGEWETIGVLEPTP